MPKKMTKNSCKKYELAITNFVLGEETKIPREELINHLRVCANCREDIKEWRATYAVMRAKEYDSRPEVKEKWDNFLKELTAGKLTSKPARQSALEVATDAKREIDSAAEKIHNFVKAYTGSRRDKKVAIPVIRKGTGFVDYPFYEAMGSLVTNEKLTLTKDKDNKPDCVLLVPILR